MSPINPPEPKAYNTLGLSLDQLQAMPLPELRALLRSQQRPAKSALIRDLWAIDRAMEVVAAEMADNLNRNVLAEAREA